MVRRIRPQTVKNWYMFVCISCGLWGGLLVGLQTEYFTSNRYKPVQVGEGSSRRAWTPA